MLQWQSICNLQGMAPYRHHCLLICAQLGLTTKLWAPTTLVHTTTTLLQECIFVQVNSKVQLITSSRPDHSSTITVSLQIGYHILPNIVSPM